jgi:hypothetical protein
MPLHVHCPSCQAIFTLSEELAGKRMRCPSCREVVQVAALAEPAERSAKKSAPVGLIVAAIVGGVMLLCCGGVAVVGYLVYSDYRSAADAVAQAQAEQAAKAKTQPAEDAGQPQAIEFDRWQADGPMFRAGGVANQPQGPEPQPVKLPPLPAAIEIKPAPVQNDTAYNLPDTVSRVAVGGGGRFLILHFPKLHKLGIFDANEAKITWYVEVPDGAILFAAGRTKLLAYEPSSNVLQRWDLLTRQREKVGKLPGSPTRVGIFCMGSASAGPLLFTGATKEFGLGARLVDIETFELLMPEDQAGNGPGGAFGDGAYWASADGRTFGHSGNLGMPNGVASTVFEEGKARGYYEHWGTWFVQPSPDGKYIYAGGCGIFTNRIKPTTDVVYSPLGGQGNCEHMYLPAHDGPYYIHLHLKSGLLAPYGLPHNKDDPAHGLTVYMLGQRQPLAQLRDTGLVTYGDMGALQGVGIEHSVHLIPRAHLLVVVPGSRDKLILHPIDLEKALDDSGVNYLLITSQPPADAKRCQKLAYQITSKSKSGGVTYKLESGPDGMAVAPDGKLTWDVPADYAKKEADVIVSVRDKEGQEKFHTFTLSLR